MVKLPPPLRSGTVDLSPPPSQGSTPAVQSGRSCVTASGSVSFVSSSPGGTVTVGNSGPEK